MMNQQSGDGKSPEDTKQLPVTFPCFLSAQHVGGIYASIGTVWTGWKRGYTGALNVITMRLDVDARI